MAAPPPKFTVDDIKKELALLGIGAGANIKSALVNRLATARGIMFRGCSLARAPTRKAAGGVGSAGKGEGCAADPEGAGRDGGGRAAAQDAVPSIGLQSSSLKRCAAADDGGNAATKRVRSDSSRLVYTQTPLDVMQARGVEAGARASSMPVPLALTAADSGEGGVHVGGKARLEDWWSFPCDSVFGRVINRLEKAVDAGFDPLCGEHVEHGELDEEDEESIYSARRSEKDDSWSPACSDHSDYGSENKQCRHCGDLFACSSDYLGRHPLCQDCR